MVFPRGSQQGSPFAGASGPARQGFGAARSRARGFGPSLRASASSALGGLAPVFGSARSGLGRAVGSAREGFGRAAGTAGRGIGAAYDIADRGFKRAGENARQDFGVAREQAGIGLGIAREKALPALGQAASAAARGGFQVGREALPGMRQDFYEGTQAIGRGAARGLVAAAEELEDATFRPSRVLAGTLGLEGTGTKKGAMTGDMTEVPDPAQKTLTAAQAPKPTARQRAATQRAATQTARARTTGTRRGGTSSARAKGSSRKSTTGTVQGSRRAAPSGDAARLDLHTGHYVSASGLTGGVDRVSGVITDINGNSIAYLDPSTQEIFEYYEGEPVLVGKVDPVTGVVNPALRPEITDALTTLLADINEDPRPITNDERLFFEGAITRTAPRARPPRIARP